MTNLHDKLIRFYFYVQSGNNLLSNFRSLIEVVLVAYIALHLKTWWFIPIMVGGGMPILALTGWYSVNFMGKVIDKINVKQGSYYTIRQFELIEGTYNQTVRTNELLEKLIEKL